MGKVEKIRLLSNQSEEIKDDLLGTLDDKIRSEEDKSGIKGAIAIEDLDPDEPYEIEIVKPRAIDLRKLYRLAGKPVPHGFDAALGSKIPILIHHGFTPFHKQGVNPKGVSSMGYQSRLEGLHEADTVSLFPSSKTTNRAVFRGKVDVGLSLGGDMKVIPPIANALSKIAGFNFHGAEVHMNTDNRFSLSITLDFSALQIQAGPIGAGGARWNIYRKEKRIDLFQPLLQTILIPDDIRSLKIIAETWIKRRGKFFGKIGSRAWRFDPVKFTTSLEGL